MYIADNFLVHIETLGCRLNQDESEGAGKAFEEAGFTVDCENISSQSPVNYNTIICLLNTCTVTAKAEQKARRLIRLLLQKFPNSVLLITGCYAQLDGLLIRQIEPSRIVIVPGRKKYLLQYIAGQIGKDLQLLKNWYDRDFLVELLNCFLDCLSLNRQYKEPEQKVFSLYTSVFKKHSRPSLKIQDGCNNACTFCRIHLARGKSLSLDVSEVVRRVIDFENVGFYEVVLTGVNLSQYSVFTKNGERIDFTKLLQILLQETDSIRFRISSFYPQHITAELCKVLESYRIQPSFHLSVQSGSDKILNTMARPYTRDSVVTAVNLLRKAKDNPFIGCDIIAGFPGESEEDFSLTKDLCNQINFSWIHAFPFSPRPGTVAFSMKNQVTENIKSERTLWLTERAVQGKLDFIKNACGKVFSAIVENSRSLRIGQPSLSSGIIHAVTENFLHVECHVKENIQSGSLIMVKIIRADEEAIRSGREIDCKGIVVGKVS